jgi:dihydrofolate reductase
VRNVVVTEFMTLDGIMEALNKWSFPYWHEEISKFKLEELFAADAQLLGRVTYEGFAAAWPKMTDEAGFADRMNGMTKYVASTTLKTADWNNSQIIQGSVTEAVARLKQEPGQNILVAGSATLVQALRQANLIDRYHLLVYPLVVGTGKSLWNPHDSTLTLELVESRTLPTGVVLMIYRPAPAAPTESEPRSGN